MTDEEKDAYNCGYIDCRDVMLSRLKKTSRNELIELLEEEIKEECFKSSGFTTKEEYEADLDSTFELIKQKYYGKDGCLKFKVIRKEQPRGEESHD